MVFALAGDSTITRFFATDLGASTPVPRRAGFAPVQIPTPSGTTPCQTKQARKACPDAG